MILIRMLACIGEYITMDTMGCGLISHHIKIDAKNHGRDENCGGVLGCLLACSISPDKKVLAAKS